MKEPVRYNSQLIWLKSVQNEVAAHTGVATTMQESDRVESTR
jgi:hypothetical protein